MKFIHPILTSFVVVLESVVIAGQIINDFIRDKFTFDSLPYY